MHHVIVTRVSATLCLLLAGCILGFAILVERSASARARAVGEPGAGAGHFETFCAGCHGVDELTGELRTAPDRDALLEEWQRFLEGHGRAGREQDRAILEYLERQTE